MNGASDRLRCSVPFCRRTRKVDPECSEWICGPHWKMVPARLRRRKYWAYRTYRRRYGDEPFWKFPAGSPNRLGAVKLARICSKAWDMAKRAAIERAAGL